MSLIVKTMQVREADKASFWRIFLSSKPQWRHRPATGFGRGLGRKHSGGHVLLAV